MFNRDRDRARKLEFLSSFTITNRAQLIFLLKKHPKKALKLTRSRLWSSKLNLLRAGFRALLLFKHFHFARANLLFCRKFYLSFEPVKNYLWEILCVSHSIFRYFCFFLKHQKKNSVYMFYGFIFLYTKEQQPFFSNGLQFSWI